MFVIFTIGFFLYLKWNLFAEQRDRPLPFINDRILSFRIEFPFIAN